LTILNYIVTSSPIHLLVADDGGREVIPNSIQLVAGGTGQEYNQRKDRKGSLLGRSLSCQSSRERWSSGTMHGLYRHEYGRPGRG
jgi:hypothetical protein